MVRFTNSVCYNGDSLNGTCYSAEECVSKGGTKGDSCAGGYGTCCTCKINFPVGLWMVHSKALLSSVCHTLMSNWNLYESFFTTTSFYFASVQLACGGKASENCSYFQSNGKEVGQCRIKICPCNENICQLRLDFQTFVLNQPNTNTVSVNKIGDKSMFEKSQCHIDTFSVTAPGNTAPPVICGTNTGLHSKAILKYELF